MKKNNIKISDDQMTRKEALSKMGKYASLTALGTFLVLNPLHSQPFSAAFLEKDDADDIFK